MKNVITVGYSSLQHGLLKQRDMANNNSYGSLLHLREQACRAKLYPVPLEGTSMQGIIVYL
jgi:hypothetical protein